MKNNTAAVDITKRYTLGEEIFNSVTHGVGGLLAIAGTAVLIVFAAVYSDAWGVVSSAVYGASLIVLYTMSTLYHALTNRRAKTFFRIMDHDTIFFLIAGTYTPITLIPLRGALGWVLFGIVWGAAILGIVMNSVNLEKFRKPSVICYVAMGWVVIFKEVFPCDMAYFHDRGKRVPLFLDIVDDRKQIKKPPRGATISVRRF